MKFLKLSPYKSEPFSHGGEKRSYQVDYFLKHVVGATCVGHKNSIYCPKSSSEKTFSNLYKFIKGWFLSKQFKSFFKFKLRHFTDLYHANKYYKEQLKSCDTDFIVWEMGCGYPGSWDYILPFVNKSNKKILGVLHNMDSLIVDRFFIDEEVMSPNWLNLELRALKHCDLVLTISWEEHWLLKLHGVNSVYYPYYPIGELTMVPERVASLREGKEKEGYLVLGSTINTPTFKATLALLEGLKDLNTDIYVAGYGSENIKEKVKAYKNIKVLGALSQEDLEQKLSEVKALILYSIPTTGALTKIPELLSCGIPIYVNNFGARSSFSLQGLTIYYNFNELKQILEEGNLPSSVNYYYPKQEQLNNIAHRINFFFTSQI